MTCTTFTPRLPIAVESACDVAVNVTAAGFGAVAGALYRPVGSIVPHGFGVPVHAVPLRLQVTAVFVVPVTAAVNCTDWVTYNAARLPSLTVTVIPLPAPLPPLAQPPASARLSKATANRQFFIMIRPL